MPNRLSTPTPTETQNMGNLAGFNSDNYEPNTGFEPIPAGDYEVAIVSSEEKPTAQNDGSYIKLTIQVTEGEFKNRKLFHNLNLKNKSQQAVDISLSTLSAICRAVGKKTVDDSSELHDLPLIAKVSIEKRKDNGELGNVVKGFKPVGGPSATPAAPATKPAAAASSGKPWERK